MLITASYHAVRDAMKPGDIIAFSGKGFISSAIKLFTRCCVSHVGIVFEILQEEKRRIRLMESTTLNGINGVQSTFLSERLAEYDGPIWWLPLSKATHAKMDEERFWRAVYKTQERKYDYRAIAHFAVDLLHIWAQAEDPGRLFCSELAAYALKEAGVLPTWLDSSEVRPVDLCQLKTYSHNYYQLKGKPLEIKGYNSKDPKNWKN